MNNTNISSSKVTTTPLTIRDHDTSTASMGLLYSSTSVVVSDASYQSPLILPNASQYENKMSASFVGSQEMVTPSTLGNNLTNPNLSSVNFYLTQDSSSSLFSDGLNLTSAYITSPLVNSQLSTVSYATSFPITTSTTSVGINFSTLGMSFPSSIATSFPHSVTNYSSAVSTSSTLSFSLLDNPNSVTMPSIAPTFGSNLSSGLNLFQAPSSSSTTPLLLGKTSSSVNTSSASFNLFSNFSLVTSTAATTEVSYSTGTSLFHTSTSGLSFQINPSALQSSPLSFNTANSTVPMSTMASGLFQQFPFSLNAKTTTSTLFNTTTWSLGMDNQLSSDDKISASKQDEDDGVEALNESQPIDDGYTPLVKLTDSYEVKSGEEDEQELFSNRGKLYRYDQPTKAWKERGVGNIKILQHNVTGKMRVLMRREHILKICCNHYITSEMELTSLVGNNTSWTWTTMSDFSDEEAKVEKLCIRFKLFEVAQNFKTVFTGCVQKVKNTKQGTFKQSSDSSDLSVKFAPKAGSWECNDCSVFNEVHITQCVACGSINPNSTVTSTLSSLYSSSLQGLGSNLSTSAGAVSFGGFQLGGITLSVVNQPISVPSVGTIQSSTVTMEDNDTESEYSSYEEQDEEEEEEEGSDVDSDVVVDSDTASNLAARFARKPGDWECSVCCISNEKDIGQCVACGNINPNITAPVSSTDNVTTVSSSITSGFKLSVSLPTAQISEPTSITVGFKLGGQSSGGFKLGGLNLGALTNKLPTPATMESSDDCIITGELKPSKDEVELAQRYMLPPTFYNYKTKPPCPGCRGCEDDTDTLTDALPSVLTSTSMTTAPVLFGASGGGLLSFAGLAKTTEFQFGLDKENKEFAGAGTMLFQSQREDCENCVNPETEVDVDFKPLVSLPDIYQLTTGQESEIQLFCERAKLFRFDPNSKQWKERGIGNMTIMKNSKSGKSRLVMRREQVLKLCCNHVILPTMELHLMSGGGNAWRWSTPCDFSDEEPKAEQLAIRFKKKEQADSFQEVISKCTQESTTVCQDTAYEDVSGSVPTEEQQFSADIKFYEFQVEDKVWERKGNGKVILITTVSGLQIMRVVDTSNCVFYEQSLSAACKLTKLPGEEKSWSCSYVRSNTSEVTRYAIRFIEISDSNEFEQMVCDHITTIVPCSPRSPEIPPLSPASSCSASPLRGRGRPLIEAVKSVGIWCCSKCNAKNPGSEPQCTKCSAPKSISSLLSTTGMQGENPFFSKGKPVDHNVSSLASSIFSLNGNTAESDGCRSYTPFNMALQHQQCDSESNGPPSLISVPSQEADSVASFEQKQEVTKSLFKMPTFSRVKPSFPLLDATGSGNFSQLSSTQDDNKEEEHPENEANIFFDPVVSLPSDFDNKSGEENEECVFMYRAKLYRYDNQLKMWKDRGIGNIKILRHKTSNKGRVLMRREQVLKLCCNHYIVSGMTLKPGSFPDRSWVWLTSADYSEEVAQPETLCVKFKDSTIARDFKNTFDSFSTTIQNATFKPTDHLCGLSQDDDVVFVGEELPKQELVDLAKRYMLPPTFYNYLTKAPCPGCMGCNDDEETEYKIATKKFDTPSTSNLLPTTTLPQDQVLMFFSNTETLSFADLAANNASGFGGAGFGSGDNKGFGDAGKPLFSTPTNNDNETPDSFESTAEFKPIVKLSSDVQLHSGEESEIVLFSHRAKLYRFDKPSTQWKERGVGNIKILEHKKTGKFRILMRREQILKLCCNHLIVKGMTLTARDEKSLRWMTLSDLSDEEAKPEQFTIRFKLAETASTFQKVFNDCLLSLYNIEGTSLKTQQTITIESASQVTSTLTTTTKEQSSVTSCSVALSVALNFPPVTTSTTALATNPVFVFGSSSNIQSNPIQVPAFSLSPPKFAFGSSSSTGSFNFTLKPTSSESNIFGSTALLQPTGKETDSGEVDEWVTESESEYLGSELNLEQSEDNDGEDDGEFFGTSVNNTLTDDIDTSVNTVQQEGDSSLTNELSLDSQAHDGETQE